MIMAPWPHRKRSSRGGASRRGPALLALERTQAGVELRAASRWQTGMNFLIIKPGQREAFLIAIAPSRRIYVVIGGAGRVKLDSELVDLMPFDAVRVSPGMARSFEAGSDGLEVLIFGPHIESDGRWSRTSGLSGASSRRPQTRRPAAANAWLAFAPYRTEPASDRYRIGRCGAGVSEVPPGSGSVRPQASAS